MNILILSDSHGRADFVGEAVERCKPDLVLFLDMPIEVSQRLLAKRYEGDESKKDIHERNVSFMKQCRDSAMYTAQRWGWSVIECSDGEAPLSIDAIHQMIMERVKAAL